ncbi:protein kinase [Candidatus Woesearchaeota archaeon]|nr:protein kinase [Candidatus Woesearchaeota archaeon]
MNLESRISRSSLSEELRDVIRNHFVTAYTQGLVQQEDDLTLFSVLRVPDRRGTSYTEKDIDMYYDLTVKHLQMRLGIEDDVCWLFDNPYDEITLVCKDWTSDERYAFNELYCTADRERLNSGLQSQIYKGLRIIGEKVIVEGQKKIRPVTNSSGKIIAYPGYFTLNLDTEEAVISGSHTYNERGFKTVRSMFSSAVDEKNGERDFRTRYVIEPIAVATDGRRQIRITPFIDGLDFGEYIKQQGHIKSLDDFLALGSCVALGADFLHEDTKNKESAIHRDFKPNNIMMSKQGELLIIDYGLLKLLTETKVRSPEADLTRKMVEKGSGNAMANPFYISPEVAYSFVYGSTNLGETKPTYLRLYDKSRDRKIPKGEIHTINRKQWVITPNQEKAEKQVEEGVPGVMRACHDERSKKYYKAYFDDEDRRNLRIALVDGRSDIFSIGLILYEALTGKKPLLCEAARSQNMSAQEFVREFGRKSFKIYAGIIENLVNKRMTLANIKDYMVYSDLQTVQPQPENFVRKLNDFGIHMDHPESITSMYTIDYKLLLMCDRKGRFIDSQGRESTGVFTIKPGAERYVLKKSRLPKVGRNSDFRTEFLRNVSNTEIDRLLTPEVCSIVNNCLRMDTEKRYDAVSLVKHFYYVYMEAEGRLKRNYFSGRFPRKEYSEMLEYFKQTYDRRRKHIAEMAGRRR